MLNIHLPPSAAFLCSELFSSDRVSLANRIKLNRVRIHIFSGDDLTKISKLLNAGNNDSFFHDRDVQRKLIKAVIDGTLINHDDSIQALLEKCTPCLSKQDQINILESRAAAISELPSEYIAEITYILRFFEADPHSHDPLPPRVQATLDRLRQQNTAPENQGEVTHTGMDSVDGDGIDEQRMVEDSPFCTTFMIPELPVVSIAFEKIAQSIAYMQGNVQALCDDWNPLSNKRLAESIVSEGCTHAQKQKLEAILSSPVDRKQFFNDAVVQMIFLQGWVDNHRIDDRILAGLCACTPNLSLAEQHSIERELMRLLQFESIPSPNRAIMLLHFLTDISPILTPPMQTKIVSDMQSAIWGNHVDMLLIWVKNLGKLTEPAAQRCIASAIRSGAFGTDPIVLQALIAKLGMFVDLRAQKWIAVAIHSGRFGTDPTVLQALIGNLKVFTYFRTQILIEKAIKRRRFGNDPNVLNALTSNAHIFANPKIKIASAIQTSCLNIYSISKLDILDKAPSKLRNLATHTDMQIDFASALSRGEFGTDPEVLKTFIRKLEKFNSPIAQQRIRFAIEDGRFGTHPDVLKALITLKPLAGSELQVGIAGGIESGIFGRDPAILQALVGNLGIFTDPESQRRIARGIESGIFGRDPAILQALVGNLGIFTDPESQRCIARAISVGRFGTDPAVLQTLAKKLGVFTDLESQRHIAVAIAVGRFGTDLTVLQALVGNLGVFTDREAQITIVLAMKYGEFGTDPVILKTLIKAMIGIPICFNVAIKLMSDLSFTPQEKIPILSQMKFSLGIPDVVGTILEQDLPYLFGAKAYTTDEAIRLVKDKFSDISGLDAHAIDESIDSEHQYALQIDEAKQRLILYPLTTDRADFLGWITSDNPVFYQQCVTNVKIFDFSELKDGYPSIIDGKDLSPDHTLFADLPGYLQQAIRDHDFKLEKFKHSAMIGFVTQTLLEPLIKENPVIAQKMISIMQLSIADGGREVHIAASNVDDAKIKNDINALCATTVGKSVDFTSIVYPFFRSLPNVDDKARLAVLLGTMAKKGVLGYHYGEANQANDLLYSLAKECFDQLKGSAGIIFPDEFHRNLGAGVCIATLTSSFINANRGRIDFDDVFAKVT